MTDREPTYSDEPDWHDPVTRSLPAILTCLSLVALCIAGGLAARWMGWL